MCIKGIIFDFNGTLFFDSHYHETAWKKIAKEVFHREMTVEEMRQHLHGRKNDKIIAYLAQGKIAKQESESISKQKEQWYREACIKNKDTTKLVDGVIEFFTFLKENDIPFTIASASIKENIDFFVEIFGLHNFLDPNTITYDNGVYEDKVAMFQDAAKNIGVAIEDCLVFEDSFSGIRFAKQANAKGIFVIDESNDKEKYQDFPYILGHKNNFKDMDKVIQPWLSNKV